MNSKYTIEPAYIEGEKGLLFSIHYRPHDLEKKSECFIVVQSFAEEMNRCRYMCTMLAQLLGKNNFGYLLVDSYGTGDSEGDFIDADWEQGCRDLLTAVSYAESLGYNKISLVSIRLGALQTMQVVSSIKKLNRLIFWQPVINGQVALRQFLRIKIAASIGRNEEPGTIDEFDAAIERGESLDVAGYDISPALYKGMKSSCFDDFIDFNAVPIGWFTTLSSTDRKTPRPELNMIDKWKREGANIDHRIIIGPSYWQVHERTLVPELVSATVDYIMGVD